MDEHEWLAEQFEAQRPHLRAVAYRMLGDLSEADDAVQESWLHLSRSGTSGVENLGGWLTKVVARICLDMLRSRNSRREESLEAAVSESIESREEGIDPEQEAYLAKYAGSAAGRLGRACAAGRSRHPTSRRAARLRAARHLRGAFRRDCAYCGAFGDGSKAARESRMPPRAESGNGEACRLLVVHWLLWLICTLLSKRYESEKRSFILFDRQHFALRPRSSF